MQYKIYKEFKDEIPSKQKKEEKKCSICESTRKTSYYNKNGLHILLCERHRKQYDKYGEVHEPIYYKNIKNKCEVCGLADQLCLWKNEVTLCRKHYCQMYEFGKIIPITKKDLNEIIIYEDHVEIILRNNKHKEIGRALISLDKIKKVEKFKWHLNESGYAVTLIDNKIEQLHRFLLNVNDNTVEVDHIDRNRLDCRNENLRICSKQDNNFNNSIYKNNTSGYHDIRWIDDLQKWKVRISVNKKRISLGCYASFEDALKARLEAEEKYFGEFAPNIINQQDYMKIVGVKKDKQNKKCEICSSEYRVQKNKKTGQLLCRRHSTQIYNHGKIIKE